MAALVEQRGQIVSRDHLAERIWGKGVFLDADNSLNIAVRKLRQALADDPDQPHFIQTVTGQGYRLIATVVETGLAPEPASPKPDSLALAPTIGPPKSCPWQALTAAAVVLIIVGGCLFERKILELDAMLEHIQSMRALVKQQGKCRCTALEECGKKMFEKRCDRPKLPQRPQHKASV